MLKLLFTCEHSSAAVPEEYKSLFSKRSKILKTHRGYDIGAIEIAERFQLEFKAPLFSGKVSRLLVDLNRDLRSKSLFTEFSKPLSETEKFKLIKTYHAPHHLKCGNWVAAQIMKGHKVLHIGVHSFTPILNGEIRTTDLSLLYDPSRLSEIQFCNQWITEWKKIGSGFRIRKNYPYLGKNSGLVSVLRQKFPATKYVGIELEVNQKFFQKRQLSNAKSLLLNSLVSSLKASLLKFT